MKHLYVENEKKWEEIYNRNYCINEPARVMEIENGIILPAKKEKVPNAIDYVTSGGVCDEKFNFIAGWTRKKNGMNKSCLKSYQVNKDEIIHIHSTVVFGGVVDTHFGHFFAEGLSRLWWVVQHPDEYEKIIFVLTEKEKDYLFDFFDLLNIKKEKVEYITKPTQFDRVIVPDETMYLWSGFKKELNIVYKKIVSNLPESKYDKVYFTRTRFSKQDCINEKYFEDYFRSKGYHIVASEELPVVEQLSIAAGAKEVACVCGSLSHFALFSKPKTKYIILNRVRDHWFVPQIVINQLRDIEDIFIDCTNNYFPVKYNRGCFLMEPNQFWNDWLEDNGEEIQKLTENQTAINAYRFIRKWHENYMKKSAMSTIYKYDSLDFLNAIDRALGGKGISRISMGYEKRAADRLNELKCEIEELKIRIEEQDKEMCKLLRDNEEYYQRINEIESGKGYMFLQYINMVRKTIKKCINEMLSNI